MPRQLWAASRKTMRGLLFVRDLFDTNCPNAASCLMTVMSPCSVSRYERLHFFVGADRQTVSFDFAQDEAHLLAVVVRGNVRKLVIDPEARINVRYRARDPLFEPAPPPKIPAALGPVAGAQGVAVREPARPAQGHAVQPEVPLHSVARLQAVIGELRSDALCRRMAGSDEYRRFLLACRVLPDEDAYFRVAEAMLALAANVRARPQIVQERALISACLPPGEPCPLCLEGVSLAHFRDAAQELVKLHTAKEYLLAALHADLRLDMPQLVLTRLNGVLRTRSQTPAQAEQVLDVLQHLAGALRSEVINVSLRNNNYEVRVPLKKLFPRSEPPDDFQPFLPAELLTEHYGAFLRWLHTSIGTLLVSNRQNTMAQQAPAAAARAEDGAEAISLFEEIPEMFRESQELLRRAMLARQEETLRARAAEAPPVPVVPPVRPAEENGSEGTIEGGEVEARSITLAPLPRGRPHPRRGLHVPPLEQPQAFELLLDEI